jgi:ABC-2 type transport system ATP-binding protein
VASGLPPPAIEVEGLSKRFGAIAADEGLSFSVRAGEIFGLLGPNGAGKTTLTRMLTALLPPTSGRARVAGHDVVREKAAVRGAIGVVPQAMTSDVMLTVYENLSVYGKLFGLWGKTLQQRIEERLQQVQLRDSRDVLVGELSGGMRRRVEIARGILHRPKVLFLDEPTTGLDPQSRRTIRELLIQLKKESDLSIVLTTHAMDEAELLCDRVAILDRGRLVALDTPAALRSLLHAERRLELHLDRDLDEPTFRAVGSLAGLSMRRESARVVVLLARSGQELEQAAEEALARRGYSVTHRATAPVGLEDVFLDITGHAFEAES